MFRTLSTVVLVVLVAVGNLALPGCSNQAEPSKQDAKSREIAVDLDNGLKLEMVLIPAGEFIMGTPASDLDAWSKYGNGKLQHRVQITKPFHLGKYLVTQEQWEAVMGNNPSRFKGPKNPVEQVSWADCQQFIDKLNQRQGKPAGKFQLPSEAQWEYACRAGSLTRYYFGDDKEQLGEYGWYDKNSGRQTHPVGGKKPNAWGLYDMHGNVWEWCQDWLDEPTGAETGSARVIRGGSWSSPDWDCRSEFRFGGPGNGNNMLGFRVALVPADK